MGFIPRFISSLSAQNSVVVLGSSHCARSLFRAAAFAVFSALVAALAARSSPAACISAAEEGEEGSVVVGSTSRRLLDVENNRAAVVVDIDGNCVEYAGRRHSAIGRATC